MSDDRIVHIGGDSSLRYTPEDTLKEAIKDVGIKGALEKGKKILVLALDDTDGDRYSLSYYQAGLKTSECISLCEISKSVFKENMGFN